MSWKWKQFYWDISRAPYVIFSLTNLELNDVIVKVYHLYVMRLNRFNQKNFNGEFLIKKGIWTDMESEAMERMIFE